MKEVKAYIRPTFLDSTIESLEKAGARDITIVRVDAIGALADYEFDRWHMLRKYQEKYSSMAKIEIVCHDREARTFAEIIKEHGHTGERGDGRVFIAPIETAINIRTGEEGDDAL